MKIILKLTFLTLLVFALVVFLNLKNTNAQYQKKKELRYVPNDAFGYGEQLEYKVGYKFITAGTGYFHIQPNPVVINGRNSYDIRFQVSSLQSLEWLYKVRDQYRTVLDVAGIFPWEFEQHVREGGYKRDFKAYFDQYYNAAKTKDTTYVVPDYVHDIVSAFFYVRTMNIGSMRKDSVFYLSNFFDNSTYSLGIRIKGKDVIEVEAGKFRCIVIEPMVLEGGLFKSEGSIYVWLSDDDRKIPVKVATKIPIGFVEAKLTSYSGLRGPLKSKIED